MNVLLDHTTPFIFAHGGFQIQIEQTKAALEANGIGVEYLKWWDDSQKPDLIQYFGRATPGYFHHARRKGIRVVMEVLLTGPGSRGPAAHFVHGSAVKLFSAVLPRVIADRFAWESFRLADACVANTEWEAKLMRDLFGAPRNRVHVIPNGVEMDFLDSPAVTRGSWLVCTATITERKRVLELAEAAVSARTPLWVVGKPYAESDPYARKFFEVASNHPDLVRYEGALSDRRKLAAVYRQARGFVLLSTRETMSLSASEAAACGCPLLLSDLPWARTVFGDKAWYCPITNSKSRTAAVLKRFHAAAPTLEPPPKPAPWREVGARFKQLYEIVLSASAGSPQPTF